MTEKWTVKQTWSIETEDEDGNITPVYDEDGNLITYENGGDAMEQYGTEHPDSTFIGPKRWPEKG